MLKDNTTIILKSNALVPYHVQVILLKCTAKFIYWLIENGHTVVGFRQIRIDEKVKDSCHVHEVLSSIYWFSSTDKVLGEKTRRFCEC